MTFRTTINSKDKPADFLKQGFKSMFSNYNMEAKTVPPVDTKRDQPRTEKKD